MDGPLKAALFEEAGDDRGQVDIAVGAQEERSDQLASEASIAAVGVDTEGAQFMAIAVFFEGDEAGDPALILCQPE